MNPIKFATAALATTTKTFSRTMMSKSSATERSILCSDGVRIAYQHYPIAPYDTIKSQETRTTNADRCPILCIHGWLDNAASFHLLAPYLSSHLGVEGGSISSEDLAVSANPKEESDGKGETSSSHSEIVVLDLPGHGLSSHKSSDGPPQLLSEYAYYVAEITSALSWDKFDIVGHSMGTGVGIVYAAAFPERVRRMVLLEGAGPLSRNASDCARHVRAACDRRMRSNKLLYPKDSGESPPPSTARVYPSIGAAVEARMDTARRFPGTQYLSEQAAHAMVARATIPAPSVSSKSSEDSAKKEEGERQTPVTFRHDPRLQWPSLQYFTREQVDSLYENISCPTCLLLAEDGWPSDRRSQESVENILKPTYTKLLPGSHHFHADPDTVDAVAAEAVSFLRRAD